MGLPIEHNPALAYRVDPIGTGISQPSKAVIPVDGIPIAGFTGTDLLSEGPSAPIIQPDAGTQTNTPEPQAEETTSWYWTFSKEALKVGVIVGATVVAGPLGGIVASGLVSVADQKLSKGEVDWKEAGIDMALGAIPGGVGAAAGKAVAAFGKTVAKEAATEAAEQAGKEAATTLVEETGKEVVEATAGEVAEQVGTEAARSVATEAGKQAAVGTTVQNTGSSATQSVVQQSSRASAKQVAAQSAVDGAALGYADGFVHTAYDSYKDTGAVDFGKAHQAGTTSAMAGAVGGAALGSAAHYFVSRASQKSLQKQVLPPAANPFSQATTRVSGSAVPVIQPRRLAPHAETNAALHPEPANAVDMAELPEARVIRPGEGAPSQGYHQVSFQDTKTGQTYRLIRTEVDGQDPLYRLESADGTLISEKQIPDQDLPRGIVIDGDMKSLDVTGRRAPELSHMQAVTLYLRRNQPFATYETYNIEDIQEGIFGPISHGFKDPSAIYHHLLERLNRGERIDFINMSYGTEVSLENLSIALGREINTGNIAHYFADLRSMVNRIAIASDNLDVAENAQFLNGLKDRFIEAKKQAALSQDNLTVAMIDKINATDYEVEFNQFVKLVKMEHQAMAKFEELAAQGIKIYKSSGNSSGQTFDLSALSPSVISIGALDETGRLADYTSIPGINPRYERGTFKPNHSDEGVNLTGTTDYVDIPARELTPLNALQLRYLGKPLQNFLLTLEKTAEVLRVAEQLANEGKNYRTHFMRYLRQEGIQNALIRAEDFAKLTTFFPENFGDTREFGNTAREYGAYVNMDGCYQVFDANEQGIITTPRRFALTAIEGTSFSAPCAAAKDSLQSFVQQFFPEAFQPAS